MTLPVIAILGAGDLGSACALRLFRSGFKVLLIDQSGNQDIHFIRNFVSAIYSGKKEINGVRARTASGLVEQETLSFDNFEESFLPFMLNNNEIALLTDKDLDSLSTAKVAYIVNTNSKLKELPAIVELLKGEVKTIAFEFNSTGDDNYIVSENGLVIYPFLKDEFDASTVGKHKTKTEQVKAPIEGVFIAAKEINTVVHLKDEIGKINDISILSPYEGKLSGCLNSGAYVNSGDVIAEIISLKDETEDGRKIPDKFTLMAGGVLEALMFDINLEKNNNI